MQRSELAGDGTAGEARAEPDERTTENTSDGSIRDSDPAEETSVNTPIEDSSSTPTEPESTSETATAAETTSGGVSEPEGETGGDTAESARGFRPSPRPRPTPAEPTADEATADEATADEAEPAGAAGPAAPIKPSPRPRPRPTPEAERTHEEQATEPADASNTAASPSAESAQWSAPTPAAVLPVEEPSAATPTTSEPDPWPALTPAVDSSPGWGHLDEDDHSTDPDTTAARVKDPEAGARRRKRWVRRIAITAATIALMLFIPAFIVRMYGIPSESMETTLHGCAGCDNDRVLVDRTVYRFRDPRPGEVVVFNAGPEIWGNSEEQAPGESNPLIRGLQSIGEMVGIAPPSGPDFVKRVIAVGGQTVSCCDSRNRIIVDGVPIDEPYVYFSLTAGQAKQAPFPKIKVPEGKMWMMGDNRNASLDSRAPGNGPVPVSALAGKVRMIIYPLSRLGSVDDTNPQAPR